MRGPDYLPDLAPRRLGDDREAVRKAVRFMKDRHEGQMRVGGEPFYTHLIATATLLKEQFDADEKTIIAGLLHDIIEDTDTELEEIRQRFGDEIAHMVDGCTLPRKSGGASVNAREKIESFAEDDHRVYLVKIADRWHNMLTTDVMPDRSIERNARESLRFHIPKCRELGYERQADLFEKAVKESLA